MREHINPAKVRDDRLLGCFGLFLRIGKYLPDTIEINLNILSAFSINLCLAFSTCSVAPYVIVSSLI